MWNLSFYLAMIDDEADQKKFKELYLEYSDLMLYRARNILDHHLAEDAVNTAFLRIAQNIEKVEKAVSPRTKALVMRIVENIAIDMYRKRKREQGNDTDLSEVENMSISQEEQPWTDNLLAQAILLLPPDYQQVILLKYSQGYNNREIAELLGYTVSKVEKLISRGKKRLGELLEEVSAE